MRKSRASAPRFATIDEALRDFRRGRVLVVVDDESRENEGDFIAAAQTVTPRIINFMAQHGRGLICLPAVASRLDELGIPAMVPTNTAKLGTPFGVAIDAVRGTTTGISAYDRARTVKTVLDPKTRPADLARPGHVFPLRASEGGVLRRAGHTEAAVDLARLAGLYPAGVLCEIMDSDGRMARLPRLVQIARRLKLKMVTIKDLIHHRMMTERLVRRIVETILPTPYGDFQVVVFESILDEYHHLALIRGKVAGKKDVLVRVHSQCLTGDVFASLRCDCGAQLHTALRKINRAGSGVLIYMRQEGRGIGLSNKLRAYALQDRGLDTVDANLALGFEPDLRDYGIGAQILADLGLTTIRLMTNNPRKLVGLEGYGLRVTERVPLVAGPTRRNLQYLLTKRDRLGHLLGDIGIDEGGEGELQRNKR